MLASNLDRLLKSRRIGIRELSKGSGVPASTISKWISSNQEPKASALLRVAKFLGVSMESLLDDTPKQNPANDELYRAFDADFFQLFQGEFRITVERKRE